MVVFVALGAGLAAGATHVVMGPDHLAAVLPLSVGQGRRAAGIGLSWGLGHALGVVALVVAGQVLRSVVDVAAWSAGSEWMVGVVLVGLGIVTIVRATRLTVHTHSHGQDDDHGHVHVHVGDATVDTPAHARTPHGHRHSAFGFGLLHGMAGTGHLVGVLPTVALSAGPAVAYTIGYLAAAIAAMSGFGLLAGQLVERPSWIRAALGTSGALAMVIGAVWLVTV
ncbi:MAG: hypothetical protein AAF602_25580 [Myxococcota bacterium]